DVWFPVGDTFPHQAHWLDGVGRLKAGITLEQARADLMRLHKNAISIQPSVITQNRPYIIT
ncbi:MAG TPA: hypothetical protein VGV35_08545, partial [Bryobacteraceae bacterium]|nr:hypothetical protein [Bryobacteraceae bacterium]